jgi:lipopolysaccharide transport system ATP-binding protein
MDPEVLLLDEVLAVGDASFQAKSHARVEEIARSGRTVLFVSHDVGSVARLCHNAIVLREGLITYRGPADEAVSHYLGGEVAPLDRSPREGRGRVLSIGAVEARSANGIGRVQTGSPFQIGVQLNALEPTQVEDLRVELAINHPTGGQYVAFSTDLDGREQIASETVAGRVELVCDVESMPLKPGLYIIGVAVYRHGVVIDQLHRAARLMLLAAPFFDSGGVPVNHPAPVLVRHRWALAEAWDEAPKAHTDAVTAVRRH